MGSTRTIAAPAAAPARLHRIPAPGGDGVGLGILERRGPDAAGRSRPVLLVHGATFGAALFDLPRPGYSLMARLAGAGRPVYALDVRGYGHSLGGRVMEAPADANPPYARAPDAVRDIGAAVDFVLAREETDSLDLIGFSWGTITSAIYAGDNRARIGRLVLYAPLYAARNDDWLNQIGDPADRGRPHPSIGAYRMVTQADVTRRWDNDLASVGARGQRESGLAELVFDVCADLDVKARAGRVPEFRCPAGALVDLVEVFNGRPIYDPSRLTMPVLLVRGADDTTATDADARRLHAKIASPAKEYQVVAPGSHFLCVERNRAELYHRFERFLGAEAG